MEKSEIIRNAENFIRQKLLNEDSGHDWWHVHKVRILAKKIAANEDADLFIVELAALLHDIADYKFHGGDHSVGPKKAREYLQSLDVNEDEINHISEIIEKISFSANTGVLPTIEGRIVQDADRLEALGAIGIARCFATGSKLGSVIYNPDTKEHSIQHFYDKLLKVKDLMNTKKGKALAEDRHKFLEKFLEEFNQEWNGEK